MLDLRALENDSTHHVKFRVDLTLHASLTRELGSTPHTDSSASVIRVAIRWESNFLGACSACPHGYKIHVGGR